MRVSQERTDRIMRECKRLADKNERSVYLYDSAAPGPTPPIDPVGPRCASCASLGLALKRSLLFDPSRLCPAASPCPRPRARNQLRLDHAVRM